MLDHLVPPVADRVIHLHDIAGPNRHRRGQQRQRNPEHFGGRGRGTRGLHRASRGQEPVGNHGSGLIPGRGDGVHPGIGRRHHPDVQARPRTHRRDCREGRGTRALTMSGTCAHLCTATAKGRPLLRPMPAAWWFATGPPGEGPDRARRLPHATAPGAGSVERSPDRDECSIEGRLRRWCPV